MAVLISAMDSLALSIGPPGSASEIASPATNGARTTRVHSSSGKSCLVVTTTPISLAASLVLRIGLTIGPATLAPAEAGTCRGP